MNKIHQNIPDNLKHIYFLCANPIYVIQWYLPLLVIYPSPVIVIDDAENLRVIDYFVNLGFPETMFYIISGEDYIKFIENVDFDVCCICCGNPTYVDLSNIIRNDKYNVKTFSHGCDEDEIYRDFIVFDKNLDYRNKHPANYAYELWPNRFHMSFSRPALLLQEFTSNELVNEFNIDVKKKTILIVETNHPWGWCFINKRFADTTVSANIEKSIISLADKYNVILRLHPLDYMSYDYYVDAFIKHPSIVVVSSNDYPQFTSFLQLADVVVGSPNGVVCASLCCLPTKPIVELIPHKTWNKIVNFDTLRKSNEDLMINEKHVIVQYEDNINILTKIEEASKTINDKIDERKKYISKWYRTIDEYGHLYQLADLFTLVNLFE